jgi:hypothetical protein
MRTITFSELISEGANVTHIAAVERRWKHNNVNRYPEGRGQNIISYTLCGKKHIYAGDEEHPICSLSAPAAVLIARGAPYVSRTELTEEEEYGHTICVRFALTDDAGEELILDEPYRYWQNDPDGRLLSLFRGILSAFLAPGTPRLLLKARLLELLHELEEADVQVMVRTKDPGVHNSLLAYLLPDRKDPVTVMKPSVHEVDLDTKRVDATVVALGSCKEVARTLVVCRRIRRARHFGKIFQALSVGGGALLAGLLALLGGAVRLPAILVTVYLLLWCGVHALTSYFYLRDKNEE